MKLPAFSALLFLSLSGIMISCNDKGNTNEPLLLFSQEITVSEDDPDGIVSIPVYLSGESDQEVSFDFSTSDSTSVAGRDYVAITSGKVIFQPGHLTGEIQLTLKPDTSVKQDVYLKVKFSNPVNGRLDYSTMKVRLFNVDFKKLTWYEGFEAALLNTTIWNYETGGGGWGNNELQSYNSSELNVHLDSGYLHITARNPSVNTYTSGRINTYGRKSFTFFRADIRAKLPEGQGIWPAIWTLGTSYATLGWPKCGEMDIMELLGHQPEVTHGAVHFDSGGHASRTDSYSLPSGKFSSDFHIFSLIWTPNKLTWLVDDEEYFAIDRTEIPAFPFDLPQFLILNVAVGGNWPGPPDQTTVFPQHMIVDYIKIYQ